MRADTGFRGASLRGRVGWASLSSALLALAAWAGPISGQAAPSPALGFGVYWGSLCAAGECVESVNGGGVSATYVRPLGTRVEADVSTAFWYGSTREETVQRVTVYAAARVFPSTSAPVFVKAGGGLSWDVDGGGANPAGVLGVGWEIRDRLGVVVTPFIDAAFFGPPEPLPTLRLVSGGVQVAWPL